MSFGNQGTPSTVPFSSSSSSSTLPHPLDPRKRSLDSVHENDILQENGAGASGASGNSSTNSLLEHSMLLAASSVDGLVGDMTGKEENQQMEFTNSSSLAAATANKKQRQTPSSNTTTTTTTTNTISNSKTSIPFTAYHSHLHQQHQQNSMSSLDSINSDSLPEKVGNLDTDELCSDLAVYTKIDEENARKRLSSSIVVTSPGGGEEEHHQQLLHVSTNNIKLSPLLNPNSASMRPISPSSALSPISALDGYSPFSSTGNGNPSGNTIVRTASPASATVDMADPIVKSPILSHAKISAGGGGNNSGTVSLSPVSAAVVLSPSHNNETSSQQQQHQHQKSDWSTGTRASSSPKSRDGLAQTQHDSSSGASPANSGDKILSARALVQAKDAGVIIGKKGAMIEQLRQKSGARITVSELIPGVHERILSIAGPLEAVVRAYDEVLGKILEKRRSTEYEEVSTGGGGGEHQQQGDVSTMVIKVLLPHIRMGNIIGKHGSKIKEIGESCGARVTAVEEVLPGSNERQVIIHGKHEAIVSAVEKIYRLVNECEERDGPALVTPYVPRPPGISHQQHNPYYPPPPPPSSSQQYPSWDQQQSNGTDLGVPPTSEGEASANAVGNGATTSSVSNMASIATATSNAVSSSFPSSTSALASFSSSSSSLPLSHPHPLPPNSAPYQQQQQRLHHHHLQQHQQQPQYYQYNQHPYSHPHPHSQPPHPPPHLSHLHHHPHAPPPSSPYDLGRHHPPPFQQPPPHPHYPHHFSQPIPAPPFYQQQLHQNPFQVHLQQQVNARFLPPSTPPTAITTNAQGQATQTLYIPRELVGGIIGKGGAKINELRAQTGCIIKIASSPQMDGGDASSPPGAVDRSVTVSGSSVELVQHTVYVLQCRVDEERQRYMTGNIGPGQGHGRSGPGRY